VASNRQQREQREARERLRAYQARQEVHESQGRRRRRDNIIGIVGGVLVAALAITTQVIYFTVGPGMPEPTPSASPTAEADDQNVGAPGADLAEGRTWTGELVFNDTVTLGIALDGAAAPQAVSGWVADVQDDYYLGKSCHRLANGATFSFLQCGSLDGTGAPDPDFSYGPVENAPADGIYPAGTIAMARSDSAYSNGSQFFITYKDTPLDTSTGGYTVFGHVTRGLDEFISTIADKGTADGSADGPPKVATSITKVTVK